MFCETVQAEDVEVEREEPDTVDCITGLCFKEVEETAVLNFRQGMEATLRSSLKKFSFGGRGTGKSGFCGHTLTKLSNDDRETEEKSGEYEDEMEGTSPDEYDRLDMEDKVPREMEEALLDAGSGAHVTFLKGAGFDEYEKCTGG